MLQSSAIRIALPLGLCVVAAVFATTARAQTPPPKSTPPPVCGPPRLKAGCEWISALSAREDALQPRGSGKSMAVADPLLWLDRTGHSLAFSGSFFPTRFGRGAHVLWDPIHHLLAYFTSGCGGSASTLLRYSGKPPVAIAQTDLSVVRTQQGLTIGSTGEHIRALLGQPTISLDPQDRNRVGYTYNSPGNGCNGKQKFIPFSLNFVLENNRVVFVEEDRGC